MCVTFPVDDVGFIDSTKLRVLLSRKGKFTIGTPKSTRIEVCFVLNKAKVTFVRLIYTTQQPLSEHCVFDMTLELTQYLWVVLAFCCSRKYLNRVLG